MKRGAWLLLLAAIGAGLGAGAAHTWDRLDRTLTAIERAALATEQAARELETTAGAARRAFISDK